MNQLFTIFFFCLFVSSNTYASNDANLNILAERIDSLEKSILQIQKHLGIAPMQNAEVPATENNSQTNENGLEAPKREFFVEKANSIVANDKQEYDVALSLLKEGKYEEAGEKFGLFIAERSKSKLLSNAMFWYAETFFHRNNYDQAAVYYLKSYKNQSQGAKSADALLKLAITLSHLNKKRDACAILDKLEKEFPSRPLTSIKRAKEAKEKISCPQLK